MVDAPKRILIVGGVAGGASCAARARRLCERCEIVIFDRGPVVSFANCGLPYFVGDVIREEADLLVATPDLFAERFNIQVRTRTEVLRIDRERRAIGVRDPETGHESSEPYDALVLCPGARPIRPPEPESVRRRPGSRGPCRPIATQSRGSQMKTGMSRSVRAW